MALSGDYGFVGCFCFCFCLGEERPRARENKIFKKKKNEKEYFNEVVKKKIFDAMCIVE